MNPAHAGLLVVVIASLATAADPAAPAFKPPDPPPNLPELGKSIQRTMTLLATSTPKKRNRVRILFYGQSVTAGPWSKTLTDDLRKAFPNADIEVENRAIGGYDAAALINTADYDLYPFYPDLMIFHVYDGVTDGNFERILARTRARTTAEILVRTPHFRWPLDMPRDGNPDDPKAQGLYRADETQSKLIRELAPKYGCELAEVREPLRAYLKANDLLPKDILRDSVHPNALGQFLIAKLVLPYLRYDPAFPKTPWENLVRDVPVPGSSVKGGADGSLELTFEGNRIDLIAAHTQESKLGTAKILIDGKAPSEFPELYYHSRPNAAPQVWWPAVNRIGWEKPLVLETWTAKILECDPEKNVLSYEVIGSKTGPDGKGDQNQRFVSNSGRVVIDKDLWMICPALRYMKIHLPKDYEVKWEVKPLFVDVYRAPKTEDPAKEDAVTLAQGLRNSQHTLKLIPNGDGAVPVAALRVYRPSLPSPAPAGGK
jgi:hypothetical protein